MRARDYRPGELVSGTVYRVVRQIGAGGMGSVYDVEDTTVGKRFVLKTLHPKLGDRDDLARRIQKEARILGRLNHPNIVEVITAGVTADSLHLPYYVMERLSGQSLRVVLEKKGRLDLSHAYHIGIDLLDALDHAHDKGVIHRDVKPDNIFLHRPMVGLTITKLLDFGIVSVLDGSNGETAGRFLGTLRYAAPEQLRGEKPSPKTDVYAAALVLYEIVAGRGPFDDEGDGHQIAAAHMHKFPLPVSQLVKVPREFDVLLMAGLAKNPDARPRDAFSFAASLRNLQRRLDEWRPRQSTESRITTSEVIDRESAPSIPPTQATPAPTGGPGVAQLSLPPMRPPQSTLVGMPTPTLAPGLTTEVPNTTVRAQLVDRAATTSSMAGDTLRMPQHATEVLGVDWPPPPSSTAPGEASTEIEWPSLRVPIPSVEPQVRSLPASGPPVRARFSRRLLPLASAGLGVAVGVAVLVLAAHPRRAGDRPAGGMSAPPATTLPSNVAVVPSTSDTRVSSGDLPGGSIPGLPAAMADGGVGSEVVSEVRGPPPMIPAARSTPAPSHPMSPPMAPRPARPVTSPYASDRPGPGF